MSTMKLEGEIIRSAIRGWWEGADIAPGGSEVDDWSIGARETRSILITKVRYLIPLVGRHDVIDS